eukprot:g2796.t1
MLSTGTKGIFRACARAMLSTEAGGGAKLWGGRFTGAVDPLMNEFNASIGFDKRLSVVDARGSIAYASALERAGILTNEEFKGIESGLNDVIAEWESGEFRIVPEIDEDIHTANERRLTELIGQGIAGKLHTGRSRNDQVATDVRLWTKEQIEGLRERLRDLIYVAAERASAEIDVLMPGYTHLQPAQPIRWSHFLLSHAWAWERDLSRLDDLLVRVDVMPLGSGALAGHPFGIDRERLAKDLGFARVTNNSLDAVSDRDFIAEFHFWAALSGVHLSRWAEDLIIYSSREFGFVQCSDAYATGSSLMPQKKNPDGLELLRGKSGRSVGNLTSLLVTLKGVPSTYNKDLQEDKENLFDSVDTLTGCLDIARGILSTLSISPDAMRSALGSEMLATDVAEYLVRKGVPFRESHHISGQAVQLAETKGVSLADLTVDDMRGIHGSFEDDVSEIWSMEQSVESRSATGGTSRKSVEAQIEKLMALSRA